MSWYLDIGLVWPLTPAWIYSNCFLIFLSSFIVFFLMLWRLVLNHLLHHEETLMLCHQFLNSNLLTFSMIVLDLPIASLNYFVRFHFIHFEDILLLCTLLQKKLYSICELILFILSLRDCFILLWFYSSLFYLACTELL